MFTDMEKWIEIRRRVLSGELSKRAACVEYGIHWETLKKILAHSEPPGYRRRGDVQFVVETRDGLAVQNVKTAVRLGNLLAVARLSRRRSRDTASRSIHGRGVASKSGDQ